MAVESGKALQVQALSYPPQFSTVVPVMGRDYFVVAIEPSLADPDGGFVYVVPAGTQRPQ